MLLRSHTILLQLLLCSQTILFQLLLCSQTIPLHLLRSQTILPLHLLCSQTILLQLLLCSQTILLQLLLHSQTILLQVFILLINSSSHLSNLRQLLMEKLALPILLPYMRRFVTLQGFHHRMYNGIFVGVPIIIPRLRKISGGAGSYYILNAPQAVKQTYVLTFQRFDCSLGLDHLQSDGRNFLLVTLYLGKCLIDGGLYLVQSTLLRPVIINVLVNYITQFG